MGKSLARFLYGSQNYGLDAPESDRDYKLIVMPDAKDFWHNEMLNKHINEYESHWDYRHFTKKLIEMNPNALELLFSTEQLYFDNSFGIILDEFREFFPTVTVPSKFPEFLQWRFWNGT